MPDKAYYQNLIANAKLKQAITELLAATQANGQAELYNNLLGLSAQYNKAKKDNLGSLLADADFRVLQAKMNVSFLAFLEGWEEDFIENLKNQTQNKMTTKPSVLLTFAANDLSGVRTETDKIWANVSKSELVTAQKIENASIEDLADAIIDSENLFMFHFGGHASQNSIVLDGFLSLDKTRLSRLLTPDGHQIQLLFLNGCLSYGQVGLLTAKGVKAIIATNVEVNDSEAVRIAAYFYKLFFEKDKTLKTAFETAEATVSGKNAFVTIVNPGEIDEHQAMPSSWTLFVNDKFKEVMDWRLGDFVGRKGKENIVNTVPSFKAELYALLEAAQQDAIPNIIIKISESLYTYDKVQMTALKGANPMQLAMLPAQYVGSVKLLINSLK